MTSVHNHSLRMLGRGLFVSLFLVNVLIINITGKTLLIETQDEQDAKTNDDEKATQAAVAQGI